MLLVETYISNSSGKGFGLFAKDKIAKGTIYWARNELFDKVISQAELKSFEEITKDFLERFGFLEVSGNWYLCSDHGRFSNHSEVPNTLNHFSAAGILDYCTAAKDIDPDEEIFINYKEICSTCKDGVTFTELK